MKLDELKQRYVALCENASQQATTADYYHEVGVVRGYIKAVSDIVGADVATLIVNHAESLSKTAMGVPEYQSKTLSHA